MLTFIRGPSSFITTGQVYVKMLPSGEPVQLTRQSHEDEPGLFTGRVADCVLGYREDLGHVGRARARRRTAPVASERLRAGVDRQIEADVF
jgi:hypothetical protein